MFFFFNIFYQVEEVLYYSETVVCFCHERVLEIVERFFYINGNDHLVFPSFILSLRCITFFFNGVDLQCVSFNVYNIVSQLDMHIYLSKILFPYMLL